MSSQYTFRRPKNMGRKEDSDVTTQIEYPQHSPGGDYSKWIFWLLILVVLMVGAMTFMMFSRGIIVKVRG